MPEIVGKVVMLDLSKFFLRVGILDWITAIIAALLVAAGLIYATQAGLLFL